MNALTVDDIMAYRPCYTRERVAELFAGRTSMTIREICAVETAAKDRVWFLTRSAVLDLDLRNQWITIFVTRAVTKHALHCGILSVEDWAANWLSNTDRSTYAADAAASAAYDDAFAANAAAYAADAAAYNATKAAASAAAYDAAFAASAASATYNAAYNAAYAAASAAAYAAYAANAANAAYDAAYAAECDQQIADLLSLLPE